MKMGRIHAARVEKSPRLKRVLGFLILKQAAGATTREIMLGADVCAVNSCVAELREAGYEINCEMEAKGRFRYKLLNGRQETLF